MLARMEPLAELAQRVVRREIGDLAALEKA